MLFTGRVLSQGLLKSIYSMMFQLQLIAQRNNQNDVLSDQG